MSIDWKQKGRTCADDMVYFRGGKWVRANMAGLDAIEATLRGRFADLLAAAQWGVARECRRPTAEATAEAESEAMRLMTEGFRERVAEMMQRCAREVRHALDGNRPDRTDTAEEWP